MDLKRECERETKDEEFNNEDSIQTIMFTIGTFILMVCLKSFLVEKWRSYVFLILNVILLAILFMSMKPNYWSSRNLENFENESNVEDVKNDDKLLKKRACGISQDIEENKECYKKQCWTSTSASSTNYVNVENEINEDYEEEEDEHVEVLSKEELNERVEAFIAMFRKHLISDDVKHGENFRLQKTSNLTSKIEVSCC